MNKVVLAIIIVGAGLVVGWYAFGGSVSSLQQTIQTATVSPTPTVSVETGDNMNTSVDSGAAMGEKGGVAARTVVTYTATGFAPSVVTVKKGTVVTFMNEANSGMWVVTGVHPTHQLLPGFNQGKSVARGGNYEYTFTTVGTWKYHNELTPEQVGSVVVTE